MVQQKTKSVSKATKSESRFFVWDLLEGGQYDTIQRLRKEKYRFHLLMVTQFRIQKQYSDCLIKEVSDINFWWLYALEDIESFEYYLLILSVHHVNSIINLIFVFLNWFFSADWMMCWLCLSLRAFVLLFVHVTEQEQNKNKRNKDRHPFWGPMHPGRAKNG